MIKIEYLAEQITAPENIKLYVNKNQENICLTVSLNGNETLLYLYDLTSGQRMKIPDGLTTEAVKEKYLSVNTISIRDMCLEFLKQAPACETIEFLKFCYGKKEFWSNFSKYIEDDNHNKYGFYEDYNKFIDEYPIQKAKEFCDKNEIEYE